MDINISNKNNPKKIIVSHVKFWWMDEKWHQQDIVVVIIVRLQNSWKGVATRKLEFRYDELHCICGEL